MKTTKWSVESYVLALSVRSAVDVVGGGADTVDDDCCWRFKKNNSSSALSHILSNDGKLAWRYPSLTERLKNESIRPRSAAVVKPYHAGYVSLFTTTAWNTVSRASSGSPWCRSVRNANSDCAHFVNNSSTCKETENGHSHTAIVCGRRIVNPIQVFEWYQFEWPWVVANPDYKVRIQRQITQKQYKIVDE